MGTYEEEYNLLIQAARARKAKREPFKYEEHHIIPRCMGGTDEKENLVLLTIKEHFRAHVLLSNMYPSNGKLALACTRMLAGWQGKTIEEAENEYEFLRARAAKYISSLHKGRKASAATKENIRRARFRAKPRTFSDDAKANMAEARKKVWNVRRESGTVDEIISKTVAARKANGSYEHSEERRKRIGEAQIGRVPWNKGMKGNISEETRLKMSLAKKGKKPHNAGVKTGKPAWNKGKKGVSEETRAKMQAARLAYLAKQQLS